MRLRPIVAAVILFGLSVPAGAQDAPDEAYRALQTGEYEKARRLYQERLNDDEALQSLDVVHLAETYLLTGEYEEGLEQIDELAQANPSNPYVLHARGRLNETLGRFPEADADYRAVLDLKVDLWRNLLALGEFLDVTGRGNQTAEIFQYIFRPYRNNEFRTAEELGIAGRAAALLGENRDANEAFRTAHQLDPQNMRNLVWWGDLFREKYNDADAQRTFDEALAVNDKYAPLYVGYARLTKSFARKEEFARKALEYNPNDVEAQSILAGLHILDGQYDQATDLASRALDTNSNSVEALAQMATAHFLQDDSTAYQEFEERALNVNPRAGLFYITLAKNCELKFRYPDAVDFAQSAVQVDRRNPEAYAQLGISLLRLGRSEEARRYLEFSFDQDPFNLFISNTLTLLDEYKDFSFLESEHFRLIIHNTESDVLGPAMLDLAEEAYAALSAKYPYTPEDKILLEAYNDPDDFAVRIAGVPHLGLLGVSFGDVLALNTPRGQEPGSYNWARTLWHELVHTISIGLSEFRMPRWFAEGLAVYEERQARPEWGREMQLELLMALDQDKLLPLAEMDRGFTRPTFQGQILLSYYHASRVIGFIAQKYGEDALVAILEGFADGKNDAQSIRDATGASLTEIDSEFRESLDAEAEGLASILRGMPNPFVEDEAPGLLERLGAGSSNSFLEALREGYTALAAEDYDTAERHFTTALSLYEHYVKPGNAYQGLAAVYRVREQNDRLIDILERFLSVSEHGMAESEELGNLLREAGRNREAIGYFERSLDVGPYNRDIQNQLAELYSEIGMTREAVQARRAILGLNPVDRAEAYYQYAASLQADNQSGRAKRAVLQALEIAPSYLEAQRLLLEIVDGE